jgi:hypothetical protein
MELPCLRYRNCKFRLADAYAETSAFPRSKVMSLLTAVLARLLIISYLSKPTYRARLEEGDLHSLYYLTAIPGNYV